MGLKRRLKMMSRNPLTRRKARNKHFERRLARYDLHIYKGHLNWALSDELKAIRLKWGDTPGIPLDRCVFLHDAGRLIRAKRIPGDTAECGVRFGKSTHFLLHGLDDRERPHHIFDSFAGLSEPGSEDATAPGLKGWQQGEASVTEEQARAKLADFTNCRFYPGWIPSRFPEVAARTFALVHIDVDLYQPTLDSLEFFYPRLAAGGLIICDDYGFATCPGATRAFDAFFADKTEAALAIPTGQCLVWKD